MKLQESAENYLEAILALSEAGGQVRSIDVARRLGVTKPSVSRAVGLLRENGYIRMEEGGGLMLTPSGREIAGRIYERHQVLTAWLISIGVSPATAAADACRVEHAISQETFLRLKEYLALQEGG